MTDLQDDSGDGDEENKKQPEVVINTAGTPAQQMPQPPQLNYQNAYNAANTPAPAMTPPISAPQSINQASPQELDALKSKIAANTNIPTTTQNVDLGLNNQQQPAQPNQNMNDWQNSVNNQVGALQSTANAYKEIGNLESQKELKEAEIRNAATQKAQDITTDIAKKQGDYKNELDNFLKDHNNGHINPNQFMENKSVPQKIATAIGIMLSSIGSGMLHQENPVLKWLNAQTERDIEAQKDNINSAYSHYKEQMGDSHQAELMMRAISNQNIANQIDINAAKFKSPVQIQNAKILSNQFSGQANAMLGQIAGQRAKQDQLNTLTGASQSGQLSPAEIVEHRHRLGDIDDKQYAAANKELGQLQSVNAVKKAYLDSFNDLKGKMFGGAFSPEDRKSAKNAIAGRLMRLGEGRVTPEMADKQADSMLPAKLESDDTTDKKLQRGYMYIDGIPETPTLDGLKINYKSMQPKQFTPYGK